LEKEIAQIQMLVAIIILMQYYSLHCAAKKIGRGGFPQAQDIKLDEGRKVTDDDFIRQVRGDRFPDFEPYIGTLLLKKGSTLTDFISASMISTGLVCSHKVRSIMETHKIGMTNFYELFIRHKEITFHNYQLMHCINNYVDKIDFDKSIFHVQRIENNQKVGKVQPIQNIDEYIELSKQLDRNTYGDWKSLVPITIRFKDGFKPEHDMFLVWGITYKTYISERLKTALEKNKITGVMFDFYGEHADFE
jgi:hypothetical protein